jgi:hypothetical protein
VISGAGNAVLGAFVAVRFGEDNFTPVRQHRWSASLSIFWRGLALARRDRAVLVMLCGGGSSAAGRPEGVKLP